MCEMEHSAAGCVAETLRALVIWFPLCRNDIRGLRAFLTAGNLEVYLLSFLKGLKTFALDCRVVYKDILRAIVGGNETVTLLIAKPLHGSSCHFFPSFLYRLRPGFTIGPYVAHHYTRVTPLVPGEPGRHKATAPRD